MGGLLSTKEGLATNMDLAETPLGTYLTTVMSGFPFFDNIRREFRSAAGAEVPRRVDRSGWNEQDFASLQRHRRLALYRVFPYTFEDIDDLFWGARRRYRDSVRVTLPSLLANVRSWHWWSLAC